MQTAWLNHHTLVSSDGIPWKSHGVYQIWFHFSIEGYYIGEFIHITIKGIDDQVYLHFKYRLDCFQQDLDQSIIQAQNGNL